MTVFEKIEKKWSSSSISFLKNSEELYITIKNIGTISFFKDFIYICFYLDEKVVSCYLTLDYTFYNIDALIEFIINDKYIVKDTCFIELILSKSRDNKINYIISNNNSGE